MAQKLLKNGEFARLCNTTKDTLFHYDRLDLLKPAVIAPNGYRYYGVNQIYFFDLIATLKEVGLSLEEIKGYIKNREVDNFLAMLREKDQLLKQEQARLQRRRRLLANTIKITESSYDAEEDQILLCRCEEEYMILSEQAADHSEKALLEILGRHLRYCSKYNYYDDFAIGEIIGPEQIRQGSFLTSCFFSKIQKAVKSSFLHCKPAGTYAVKYIRNSYAGLNAAYRKFYAEVQKKNLETDGGIYQEDITNYLSESDASDYLMKLSIKIKNPAR